MLCSRGWFGFSFLQNWLLLCCYEKGMFGQKALVFACWPQTGCKMLGGSVESGSRDGVAVAPIASAAVGTSCIEAGFRVKSITQSQSSDDGKWQVREVCGRCPSSIPSNRCSNPRQRNLCPSLLPTSPPHLRLAFPFHSGLGLVLF